MDKFSAFCRKDDRYGDVPVLIVGAGGIGCELLKSLVLLGFRKLHVIDLDTIDISNLHRQFLFGIHDVGKSKALVAKEATLRFAPDADITAHFQSVITFSTSFFRQFKVVFNGLDNLEARRHVNQMCVMEGVPLVETGTAGMMGQSRLIIPDITECFDCRPHSPPKTFPICTIRSTPSTFVHCVVWAKEHIFPCIFSTMASQIDNIESLEDDGLKEALRREQEVLNKLQSLEDPLELKGFILSTLYNADIEHLAALEDVWKAANRQPPRPLSNIEAKDSHEWLMLMEGSLSRLRARNVAISFDKDDDDAMECVAALANLRALCFDIEPRKVFEVKSIAGNIIPAISTTNALIATIAVQQGLYYLTKGADAPYSTETAAKTIYVGNMDRLFSHEFDNGPSSHCHVCGTHRVKLQCPLDSPISVLIDAIRVRFPDMDEDDLQLRDGSRVLWDPFELEANVDKSFEQLNVKHGSILTIDTGNVPIVASIEVSFHVDMVFTRIISQSKRRKLEDGKENCYHSQSMVAEKQQETVELHSSEDDLEILA
jgi:ubiquitin-like 1-activating enzyme E1 B